MNKTAAGFILAISIIVAVVRFARCAQKLDTMQRQSGQETYFSDCQKAIDSGDIYITPVLQYMSKEMEVSNEKLLSVTGKLQGLVVSANQIDVYNGEDYYKNKVAGFIESLRSLTCCYLKKYEEERKNPATMQKGTITNLLNWIETFEYQSGQYGNAYFNYHNHKYNFFALKEKLKSYPAYLKGNKLQTNK